MSARWHSPRRRKQPRAGAEARLAPPLTGSLTTSQPGGHITVADEDRQWQTRVAQVRQLALTGRDLPDAVDTALDHRPVDDVASLAGVLHWQLAALTDRTATRRLGPVASLPPGAGPHHEVARQTAKLMRQRWQRSATTSATIRCRRSSPRPSVPPDHDQQLRGWLTATALTA